MRKAPLNSGYRVIVTSLLDNKEARTQVFFKDDEGWQENDWQNNIKRVTPDRVLANLLPAMLKEGKRGVTYTVTVVRV